MLQNKNERKQSNHNMYIPPFTITEKILNLVAEISEQVGILTTNIVNNVPSSMLRKKIRLEPSIHHWLSKTIA